MRTMMQTTSSVRKCLAKLSDTDSMVWYNAELVKHAMEAPMRKYTHRASTASDGTFQWKAVI